LLLLFQPPGVSVNDTLIVLPIPLCNSKPIPIALLIEPLKAGPASVTLSEVDKEKFC